MTNIDQPQIDEFENRVIRDFLKLVDDLGGVQSVSSIYAGMLSSLSESHRLAKEGGTAENYIATIMIHVSMLLGFRALKERMSMQEGEGGKEGTDTQ